MKRILTTIAVAVALIGCTNPVSNNTETPETPEVPEVPSVSSTDFYITGKVTNNGSPVKGAAVRLMKTGLTAISKDDGSYIITGTTSTAGLKKAALSKTATRINNENGAADVSVYGDTLVITVANPNKPNDSSEVVKTPVTSGVIMDLPATYIVQREIRGYLTAEDEAVVGKIRAFVYDNSVPNQIKTIDLWHDAVNKAFSSFAYFSSETNKNYTLYVKIYDVDNKFIAQSPNFAFTDNTGNIVFKDAFSIINAKPSVKIIAPEKLLPGTKTNLQVAAVDSFGGSIVKCEVAINNNNFADIKSLALAKMTANGSSINETFPVTTTLNDAVVNVYVKVTDNDNNTTTDTSILSVQNPKISLTASIVSAATNEEALFKQNDSVKITFTRLTSDDSQISTANIAKIEWLGPDSTSSWKTSSSFNTPIVAKIDTTNLLSFGTYEYKSIPTNGQIPIYNVSNAFVKIKITFNNGYVFNTTTNSFTVILNTIRFEQYNY